MGILDKANVKLVSDGSIFGTRAVFIHEDGTEEPIAPVLGARWVLDVRDGIVTPRLTLVIEMAATEIIMPAELVEFIGVKSREEIREIMSSDLLKGTSDDEQG